MTTIQNSMNEWREKLAIMKEKVQKIKDRPFEELFNTIGADIETVLYPINKNIIKVENKIGGYWRSFQFARVISTRRGYHGRLQGLYKRDLVMFLLNRGNELLKAIPKGNYKKGVVKKILELLEPLKEYQENKDYVFKHQKKFTNPLVYEACGAGNHKEQMITIHTIKWDRNYNVRGLDKTGDAISMFRLDHSLNNVYVIQQIYPEVINFLDECNEEQTKMTAKGESVKVAVRKEYMSQIVAKNL